MCQHCRVATSALVIAILSGSKPSIDGLNDEMSEQMGRAYTPEEQKGLHYTTEGVLLLAKIADIYRNPKLTEPERIKTLEGLLVRDPATRVPVEALITAANFGHYASMFLRDLTGLVWRATQVRAAEDYDRKAIDFCFSEASQEIDDYGRAQAELRAAAEDDAEPNESDKMLASLVATIATARQAPSNGAQRSPKSEPDYRH